MPYGLFIDGRRPKTKKQVREAIAAGATIELEVTSTFDARCGQLIDAYELVVGKTYFIVGPDPFVKRSWYAQLELKEGGRLSFR